MKTELQILSKSIFLQINDTKTPYELGISNGNEIINEYIKYGEIGLAFEHLIYAIESVKFKLTVEQKGKILKINIPEME